MSAILLALLASLGYGGSDYLASRATKRLNPALLVLASQALQALMLTLALAGRAPNWPGLAWGMAAGLVNGAALTLYYRALRDGPAGVVAPLVSTSMLFPVSWSLFAGSLGAPLTILGLLTAFAGRGDPDLAGFFFLVDKGVDSAGGGMERFGLRLDCSSEPFR